MNPNELTMSEDFFLVEVLTIEKRSLGGIVLPDNIEAPKASTVLVRNVHSDETYITRRTSLIEADALSDLVDGYEDKTLHILQGDAILGQFDAGVTLPIEETAGEAV